MRIHVVEATANPSAAPQFVGQHWVNKTTNRHWLAKGTASVADWVEFKAQTIPLPVAEGGTSQTTTAKGDILYAPDVGEISRFAIGPQDAVLKSNGDVPIWDTTRFDKKVSFGTLELKSTTSRGYYLSLPFFAREGSGHLNIYRNGNLLERFVDYDERNADIITGRKFYSDGVLSSSEAFINMIQLIGITSGTFTYE